ncbi:MAG TPA: hypothetical protein VFU23_01225 [Gemmatimonadales bacterium]|nr:hypothetical protein [Gemmatimonadales bacterium]
MKSMDAWKAVTTLWFASLLIAGPGLQASAGAQQAPAARSDSSPTASFASAGRAAPGFLVSDGRLGVRAVDPGQADPPSVARFRGGNYAGTGAIVGGSLGAAFGVLAGLGLKTVCESDDCNGIRPFLITVPLFGGAGALVGAGVGALFHRGRSGPS